MKNEELYKNCQSAEKAYVELWEKVVNIDTGSRYGTGINKVADIITTEFKKLDCKVEVIPVAQGTEGSHVLVTFTGTGKGKIMASAHLDTVFPAGTAAQRPFKIEGDWVKGPGVSDCKGSVLLLLFAMQQLKKLNFTDYGKITLLFNCDEEITSPDSRKIIKRLAPEHDCYLCCEPGQVGDGLVKSRKGSSQIVVEVHGVTSHAGSNPENGRNALMELAHQMQEIKKVEAVAGGTTINFTVLHCGDRVNVIPDYAKAVADMRVTKLEEIQRVKAAVRKISQQHVIPDTSVEVTVAEGNPPFAANAGTDKLISLAQECYAELGKKLVVISAGGASDANWAAAAGAIAADGFGPVKGGKNHTPQECTKLDSVVPRMYLLSRMLMQLGKGVDLKAE